MHKVAVQSCSSKLLLILKVAPQSCSTKLFPKIGPQSHYRNLFQIITPPSTKTTPKNSSMLLQTRKIIPHNCFPKLLFKVATKSRVLKKFPPPKLLPQNWRFCKPVPQNSSQKPFCKAARCYRKLLSEVAFKASPQKLLPKIVVLQSNSSANLFRKASQSCFPKLLPKAPPQSSSPML